MILYHGSNMVFRTPLLAKCSPHKDFGQGFYLSDSFDVARRTARRAVSLLTFKGCVMSDLQKQMIEFSTMDLVQSVAISRKLSLPDAMEVVYKSPFFLKLQDPETGLYRESKAYLLRLFNQELQSQRP